MALKLKTETDEFSDDEIAHMQQFSGYYEPGVLEYEKHNRLVNQIPLYAEQAGIPDYFIYHSSLDILGVDETDYLADWGNHHDKGISGGYYEASSEGYIERMYAMVGLLLRNYIDAQFITLQDLIHRVKNGNPPTAKFVCIPNFALNKAQGGDVASWELSHVLSWVLNAHSTGQQVVVYIDGLSHVNQQYGGVMKQHFDNHFKSLD